MRTGGWGHVHTVSIAQALRCFVSKEAKASLNHLEPFDEFASLVSRFSLTTYTMRHHEAYLVSPRPSPRAHAVLSMLVPKALLNDLYNVTIASNNHKEFTHMLLSALCKPRKLFFCLCLSPHYPLPSSPRCCPTRQARQQRREATCCG